MSPIHHGSVAACDACHHGGPGATAEHMMLVEPWAVPGRLSPQNHVGPPSGPTPWRGIPAPGWVPFLDAREPAWAQEWLLGRPSTVCYGNTCVDSRCTTDGWVLEPVSNRLDYWIGTWHHHPEPEYDLFTAMGVTP